MSKVVSMASFISGLVSVAIAGAVIGIGAGTLAVVATWIYRVLT